MQLSKHLSGRYSIVLAEPIISPFGSISRRALLGALLETYLSAFMATPNRNEVE